ncbi:rRNA maturation RNase YbeY [uncultured Paludibaculum sp.]|uniref:rRNA maturation RNase YbeY n=1 Tax=uncultured Paludibaculum sp. TaxID=1765020 RepID=UPI002AAB6433|nr:rRNA maturation RNase YbeY [uncultured Paludibaculum sp.]
MSPDPLLIFETRARGLERRELQKFARVLLDEVAPGRSYCALITGDEELRRLNREFRASDYATDVLSFPSGSPVGPLGDIAISTERAQAQAAENGHSTPTEIQILLLHGLLHLLGHDHETDRGQMRRLEAKWRRHFELPTGLIERAGSRGTKP